MASAPVIPVIKMELIWSVAICLTFSLMFVLSLYFRSCGEHRDHPATVRIRFLNITVACIVIVIILSFFVKGENKFDTMKSLIGVRLEGFLTASVVPLLLTMILFLGPLVLEAFEGFLGICLCPEYWRELNQHPGSRLLFIRNVIVSPAAEELVFRGCMIPLLAPHFSCYQIMLVTPLMFGVCHAHHLIEKLKAGDRLLRLILPCIFQISYTTVFGAYSVFLFLRTGHLIAPLIVHAFCNHMGFPELYWIHGYRGWQRLTVGLSFVVGLILWIFLLKPLTSPNLYGNNFYKYCHHV